MEKKELFLRELKEKYGFEGFFHYTAFDNFIKIMKDGFLYSRQRAKKENFINSANEMVINKTDDWVQNYVRFYYKEKTPTTYRNEGIKPKAVLELEKIQKDYAHMPRPVLFLFNSEIADFKNIVFANGNTAYKTKTKGFVEIEKIKKFDWAKIFERGFISDKEKNDITRIRNAEFLILNEISIAHIKNIIFRSEIDFIEAVKIFGKNEKFKIVPSKFNCNWLFLEKSNILRTENKIKIKFQYNKSHFLYKGKTYYIWDYEHKIVLSNGKSQKEIILEIKKDKKLTNILSFEIEAPIEYNKLQYFTDDIKCLEKGE